MFFLSKIASYLNIKEGLNFRFSRIRDRKKRTSQPNNEPFCLGSTEKQESRQVRTKTCVVKSSPQTIHLELVPLVAMDVWIEVESFLFERP